MSFSSQFRGYFKNWLYGQIKKQPLHRRQQPAQLFVEMLEDRTLLSALPAAVVGNTALNFESLVPAFPWGGPNIRTQATSPQIIIDPLDPTKIVEVHAVFLTSDVIPGTHIDVYTDVPSSFNVPQWVIEGDYSTDQGRTWTFFSVGQAITDPAYLGLVPAGELPYTVIQDVSASFDRNHHFYVVSLQHNTPGTGIDPQQSHTSGAIVMQRFDFTGAAPVKDMVLGTGGTNTSGIGGIIGLSSGVYTPALTDFNSPGSSVIYQWYDQDPAANPTIGIDNNLPSYTDPVTGAVQTDSMATMVSIPAVNNPNENYPADLVPKAIYVAYNVLQTYPQPTFETAIPIAQESRVFMAASADGGREFTNQELVSDLLHFRTDIVPESLPNLVPVTLTGTEASSPQIVFTQGAAQKPSFFVYDGEKSQTFFFDIATATPSQIQSILDTIPGLTGDTSVSYIGGGTTDKNVSGATFQINFLNSTAPYLLSYDGPGTLSTVSSTVADFTGVTATAGGQVMVFYNDIFSGFDRIYYDSTRPDAGDPATPVAAASTFTTGEVFVPIVDKGVTQIPIPVDFSTTGINGINLDSVTDLTVTVNLVDQSMDQLSIVLVPPPGLPAVNLLLNRVDGNGAVIHPDGNPAHFQGLPSVGNSSLGEVPVPTAPINYSPVGTVFDDNAPRFLTDGVDGFPFKQTAVDPYIGHFMPEEDNPDFAGFPGFLGLFGVGFPGTQPYNGMGALQALISTPNFMTLARGTWTLRLQDFVATNPLPPQYVDSWSLNFTGRISTTKGAFPSATLGYVQDYSGFPGGSSLALTGLPEDSFPGGTGGFGVDVPISTTFALPIAPDTPGAPNTAITTLPGAPLDIYANNNPAAPAGTTPGIGPVFSVAVDNTLGSFSPFQGRVYVAYTTGSGIDTNIQLISSDFPQGATDTSITPSTLVGVASSLDHWTIDPALGQVNDDAPGDNFTEGNRTQFNPEIAVDPVTGTLGLMWYDGRFDAQHTRLANAFTSSIDGGVTFAPDTFLNTVQQATDFYTGAVITQEPIPDNMTLASSLGFGDRTGLVIYGGRVYPAFSGNYDQPSGGVSLNGFSTTPGSLIFTNTVTIAGGPTLLSGTMGPIVNDTNAGNTDFNNTFTTDNTRQINGFVLTFDRPVDPATLTPGLINFTYRDPNTPAGSPGTDLSNQIIGITPLDLSAAHGPNVSGTPPSLSISDTIVQEPFSGRTMANFTVVLSQAVGTAISVDWKTQDATGSTAATSSGANPDYVASSGTLVFNPGQLTASFQVPVLSDAAFTSNRHFLVNLSNSPAAIVIDRTQGVGTIISDQNVPAITVGNAYVQKISNAPFTYIGQAGTPITLTALTTAAQVQAALNSIPALNGNVAVSGNVGGPFTLTFTGGTSAASLGFVNQGEITVTSATSATLSVDPVLDFPVFLNAPATSDITVDFSFTDATAKNGVDYIGVPGTLTIKKGFTTGLITATAISDQIATGNIDFLVDLTNPVNASVTQTVATGVIVDTNALAVSVGDVTIQRAATSQNANVTFYLNGISSQDVTIHYRTVAGTAVDGSDYTGTQTGSVVIPKGSQSVTVPITILGSTTAANNETFQVVITGVSNASASATNGSATVTIVDDNQLPGVYVGDAIARQNLTSTTTMVDVPIYLNYVSPTDVKLTIQTLADPTPGANQAIAGTDYIAIPPTQIDIPAGTTKFDEFVSLPTDLRVQQPINPTFALSVKSIDTANATLVRNPGIITLVSDTVQVSVGDVTVPEGGTAQFKVYLSGPSELPIAVTVATGGPNDTAVAGTDYKALTQTVTFAPGVTVLPVNVSTLASGAGNTNPIFFTLNVTGVKVGGKATTDPNFIARGTGTGTIVDNLISPAGPFVTVGDVTGVVPGAFNTTIFEFPVIVSPPVAGLTVTVAITQPPGRPTDVQPIVPAVVTLPNAQGQFVIDVTVNPNFQNALTQSFVGNRAFIITLSAPSVGTMSNKNTGTGTIIDDNATTVNMGSVAGPPGRDPSTTTPFNFPVVVSNLSSSFAPPTPTLIEGNYSTADGTATSAENDYVPIFTTQNFLNFANSSGADKFNLPVSVTGTFTPEPLPGFETFTSTLSNTTLVDQTTFNTLGAYPGKATGTAYIIDSNLLNLSVSDTSVQEGPNGATMDFFVYLNGLSGADVTFTWTLTDGTAKANIDYGLPLSGIDKIPAGSLSTEIQIPIDPETAYKGNRFFTMTLSKPINAGIQKAVGTGTIMDDELTPTLTLSDAIVKKQPSGQQLATFTVFADYPGATGASPTGVPTTVHVLLSDGTATAAEGDYVNTPITVTLPAGATSATFTVPINGDTNAEGNETFKATLANPSNGDGIAARVATPDKGVVGEGIGTIVDYHSVTSVDIGDVVAIKPLTGQLVENVPVLLSTPSPVPVTVQVDTSDGTATVAHHDYLPIVGEIVTIPANTTTFSIPVTILGNSDPTGDLSFFVTLSNPQNATVAKALGTVTIVDPNSVMGATQFLVRVNPQSAVGTYSYSVQPLVRDRIEQPFGQGGVHLTIGDVTVQDNASEADFSLLLSQSYPQTVTVQVSTNDGSAVAGKDYQPLFSQLVTFAAGATSAIVHVPLVNIGSAIEPFRTFTLSAANLTLGGSVLPASSILDVGTASIVDRNDQSNTFWSVGDGITQSGPGATINFKVFNNQAYATWTPQGPSPDILTNFKSAGAVESIAVDPNNAKHIVIGTVDGGVWQTFNADPTNPNAITWTPLTDNLKSLSIGDVVFDPTDTTGKTFYAGTGLWSNGFQLGDGAVGLYKTTDGGQTWTLLGQSVLAGHRIRAIDVSGQTILVGTVNGTGTDADSSRDYTALGGGLFRSTDGGATFVPVIGASGNTLPSGPVVSIVSDPNVAGRVYVAVGGQGIFRSDNALGNSPDSGVIWTPVNTGLATALGSLDVEMVAQSIGGATTLYAGVAAPDGTLAIYSSTNSGGQWTALAALPLNFDAGISGFAEKFNLVADPTTAGVVYVDGESGTFQGSPGVLRYDPANGSWVEIDGADTASTTAPHPDSRDLEFLGTGTLLEADDGGVYVMQTPLNSTASDWQSLNGNLNDLEFYSVSYDSTNNVLFGGAQDNGSPNQTAPDSLTWTDLIGGDGQSTAVDTTSRANGDVLRYELPNNWAGFTRLEFDNSGNLINTSTVGLRSSINAPQDSGLNAADQFFLSQNQFSTQPFVLNSVDPRLMLLGFFGVYEDADPSLANGDAGDVITEITPNVGTLTNFVSALAYGGFRAGTGYTNVALVGTLSGQLFVRGETGSSFTEVDGTGPGQLGGTGAITSISVDPADWRSVYVIRNGQLWFTSNITSLAANPFHIIGDGVSDNLGQLTSTLSTVDIVRIGNTSVPLVGAQGGVFRMLSPDVWSLYGQGLPNAVVHSITYNATQDLLAVGTYGRGAWTINGASETLLSTAPPQSSTAQTVLITTNDPTGTIVPLVDFPVTIPANSNSALVPVSLKPGVTLTSNFTFTVTISSPSSGVLGQKTVGTGIFVAPTTFDTTRLSATPINYQAVVPVSIVQGNADPTQQNVAINAASLPAPLNPKPSVPYVATSTINISGISAAQVLRDMTVTVNAEFPNTSGLLVQLIAPNNGPTFTLSANEPGSNFPDTVFDDQAPTAISERTASSVQTVTVDATGGTFTLAFNGSLVTGPLPWNASAAVVQAALDQLLSFNSGSVTVTLEASKDPNAARVYTVTMEGFATPPLLVANGNPLTGNTHSATVAPSAPAGTFTSFRPETPLSANPLAANQLNGTWTLKITNSSTANFGTLANWSLRLQTGVFASALTPNDPSFSGSLGNPMDQLQQGFTGSLTRDPTSIFAVPDPVGGVPYVQNPPFLSPPYNPTTLPMIIPGPHQDVIKYTTSDTAQTLNFSPAITLGQFKLTFNGQTTAPITWSASTTALQANIQAALDTLPTVGQGNTVVSNSSNPTITFVNQFSGTSVANLTFDNFSLIGGGITGITRASSGTPTNPLNLAIPQASLNPHTNVVTPGVLNAPIVVANAPTESVLTGLTIRVGIQHSAAADLRLSLIAPDGTTILLSDENGGGGVNYDGTTFDDNATTPITGGLAPFQGTYAPTQPLSTFNGKNINGTWTLKIEDMKFDGQHGQLLYWQLIPTSGLILNQRTSYTDVVFDRAINPSTINATNVLSVFGPIGQVFGPFTVTPNPTVPGTSTPVYPPEYANRVFRIGFALQQYSGSYSVVVGPVNNSVNPALNKTIQDLAGNAIDNNLNAGLDVAEGASPTAAASSTKSYSTPVINQVFNPGGAAFSTITVPGDYIITQDDINHIQLQVQLSHPNTPDLIATLTAPDGTVVYLFSHPGTFGATAGNAHPDPGNVTTFDDFATNLIQNSSLGLVGTYKPQTPLSVLVGKNAKGTWALTIYDEAKNPANAYSIGTASGTLVQWSLTLPFGIPGTGLGETGADDMNAGFRIFTTSASNTLSSSVWTPIGPAPENGSQTGPVSAIAVDPADSTGNTVYAGAASGGVWKTYNFLTTDPQGPNWVPLTDLGPLNGLNIGTLTAFASPDGDPNKTTIIAGTGTQVATSQTSDGLPITNSGIGFLRSTDSGRTWQVIDSSNANVTTDPVTQVQTALPISSTLRNHLFDGTAINRIVVDPTPLNGKFVVYAAISGTTAANSGLFRSLDSGVTWTQVESGLCTDVVLAGGSGSGGGGQMQVLYAGFMTGLGRTGGVYFTSSAVGTPLNTLLPVPNDGTGNPGPNQGVNSRVNIDPEAPPFPTTVITVGNPTNNPSGTTSPIVLATPAKTNQPLKDALYQGWVYAYTNNTLYETKDFGANWTQVNLPITSLNPLAVDKPTNDTTKPNFTLGVVKSIVIDPSDPNIIYIGGTNPIGFHGLGQNTNNGTASSVVRVDLTNVSDVYSFVNNDYSDATGTTAQDPGVGDTTGTGPGAVFHDFGGSPTSNVLSMLRDPANPFLAPSSLQFTGTLNFTNDGSNVHWQFFDFGQGNVNQMVDITDPLTGNIRLFSATSTGVYTGVDLGEGNIDPGIGTASSISGTRVGNLQIGQITDTGAQPSVLAGAVSGALLFAENPGVGTPMSDPNIFQDGNITWNNLSSGYGEAVVADPSGSGTVFRYQYPYTADYPLDPNTAFSPLNGNDFFQVNAPGTLPSPTATNANGTASAGTGLIQAGDFPSTTGAGQWPGLVNQGSNFAINALQNTNASGQPIDFPGMVMSSRAGRIFRASNVSLASGAGGIVWQDIGDPNILDGTYAPAVTFGAPTQIAGRNVDDFIYAGTLGGHVYVTRTGGGTNWINISNGLDGSPVLAISADPTRGSNKVFALTQNAVYYLADSSVANPVWTRLSDTAGKTYIFQNAAANQAGIQRPVWNNPSDLVPAFNAATGLTALAVDWRFAVPDNFSVPGGPTHPVLYVGADGGVVTSTDLGKTWTIFAPLNSANSASQTGGYLPSVRVTDLTLILGNTNPVTGVPDSSGGLNMLVASTYGRGDFAIRLDTSAYKNDLAIPNSGPQVASIAPAVGTFGEFLTGINVTFKGPVDPTSFTPADVAYVLGPNGSVPVQYVFDSTPTGGSGTGDEHNMYTIQFLTPQTASGTYTVLFGPSITDFSGDLMNQNGNGVNGEIGTPGSDDRFLGTVTFAANTAPTVSVIGTQQAAPGSSLTINFTVGDSTDAASTLTFTPLPTSSNTDLVPNTNISVSTIPGTNGTGRTMTITPAGNQIGDTFITLTVTDPHGASAVETFEVIFAAPVVLPPNPGAQTIPHGQTLTLPFNVTGSAALTLTVNATAISPVYNLWTLKLFSQINGTYYQNTLGLNEKWVFSKTAGVWYVIQPTGALSIWNGGKSLTRVLADQFGNPLLLDNSYWVDPTKLTAPAAPLAFAGSVVGTAPSMTLQITPPVGYAGPATVTVTGTDGLATSSLSFALTVTNAPPRFNTIGTSAVPGGIPSLNLPPSQTSLVLQMAAPAPGGYALSDADDGVSGVTLAGSTAYAANAAGIAYELTQTYGLYYTGNYYFNSEGLSEKWLQSFTTGSWYIIQPSGAFSLWNGGTSFTQLATLDNSYWLDPTKLVLAPEPAPLPANVAVDDVNHVLTITPAAQEIVKVSASDGQATTKQFFNLTVTTMAPVFSIPDQVIAHNAPANPQLSINLLNEPASPAGAVNLSDLNGLPFTTTLAVYNYIPAEAYNLSTTLDLQFHTSNYQNTLGLDERWLFSQATGSWYVIQPTGQVSKWLGGVSLTNVAFLDFSYWNNLNSLININDGNHVVAPVPLASTASFSFADNANVLTFNTDGTVAGKFLASVTAADTLSSTTKSFTLTLADTAPSFLLSTPGSTTISHTASYDATIFNVADGDAAIGGVAETPTFSAQVFPFVPGFAYELQQTYAFYSTGNYYSTGTSPKWFKSANNSSWYTIDKTGLVSKWNGGSSFTPVGTLDATYYADPTKLFNSTALPAPLNPAAITAVFSGSNATGYDLHLQPINAAGNLLVQVDATDGAATTAQYFALTVTSPTPSFTVTPQTPSVAFTNVAQAFVNNISAAPDSINAVTFTANVYPLIPGLAFQLNQQKSFVFNGSYYLNNSGLGEKWVYSNAENAWYIIEPTGKLSKWNGGSSFTQVVLDGVPVVLGPDYWADPTKLLNATSPPADLAQTGTFTTAFAGSNATGLTLTINPNGQNAGNYLIAINGNDAGAVTTQYFAQNFSDFAPTFGQPADQSIAHGVATYTLDLTNPASFANPSAIPSPTLSYAEGIPPGNLSTVTLGVKAYYATSAAVAYELNSEFNLFSTGNFYFNAIGLGEKWVRSHVNNQWYIIEPSGKFSVWNGGSSVTFVAQLDSTYYANPTTLFNAAEPASADTTAPPQNPAPGASSPLTTPAVLSYGVNNNGHTVTVNTDPNFVGSLIVKVTAQDPAGLATSQFFKLSMTSLTPTLSIVPPGPLSLSKAGTPLTVEMVGNDPDSNNSKPLNYVVTVTDVSAAAQAFALQQAQNLFVDGSIYFNYYGQQEIWLRSHASGAWYAITPDGAVHLLDSAHLLGPIVANLGTAYYNNYNLLLTASNPGTLALNKQVSAAADPSNPDAMNLTLNWTNPSFPSSGNYPVLVSVTVTNSVGSSTTQTFVVNVS